MYIISLFSGAGGLDLGFEQAGFRPIVAYDIDPAAVETYNHNRGKEIARQADLASLTADELIREVENLELDRPPRGVVGGPPCQYFSLGNRTPRQDDDPRRTLPVSYAAILPELNEKYQLDFFVLENVYGLAKPAHRDDLQCIIEMFEAAGFRVFAGILDAYNFDVPQVRKRLFLLGWNGDLYPDVEYEFPIGEPRGLTVRDAISGLTEPQLWERSLDPSQFPEHPNHWTMRPVSDKFRNRPPADLRRGTRSFRRLLWDEPSYTVAYGHNEIHVHPEGHRRLSIYEAMLLQGFPGGPEGYRLCGTLTQQVTLVSGAVPPPVAAAVARSILESIDGHPRST